MKRKQTMIKILIIDGFSIVKNLRSMKVRTPVTVMKASLDMLEREEIHSKYLDLKEGDEVVECDLIIICEHEIAVGGMRNISRPDSRRYG